MKRSMLAAVVLVLLGASAVPVLAQTDLPPGGTFTDDDDSVHEGFIEAIAAEAITRGCNPPDNSLFCPGEPVTRAQMAAFLVRALDLDPASDRGFGDVAEDSTFFDDINRLAAADITRGCNPPDNTLFCPDESVSRGQMAAFLVRGASATDGGGDLFADDDGSVFEPDIDRLATAGITKGCNPRTTPDSARRIRSPGSRWPVSWAGRSASPPTSRRPARPPRRAPRRARRSTPRRAPPRTTPPAPPTTTMATTTTAPPPA